MKMEVENGILLAQAKECVELREAGRGKNDPPLQVSHGAWPSDTLISDFYPQEM